MNWRQSWLGMLVLAAALVAVSANADNSDAIQEFGIDRGEPIEGQALFFWDGKYVEAPYVVERRGLDIYINGILVDRGPQQWVAPDYQEPKYPDPGEPPPGVSPLRKDPNDYWLKKWKYLYTLYDLSTAQEKMIEAFRKCTEFSDVHWHQKGVSVAVVDHSGKKSYLELTLGPPPPTAEQVLADREAQKTYYENPLGSAEPIVFFKFPGGSEVIFYGDNAMQALEILLSDADNDDKVKALHDKGIVGPSAGSLVVASFEGSPQLAQRHKLLKEQRRKEALAPVGQEIMRKIERAGALSHDFPLPQESGADADTSSIDDAASVPAGEQTSSDKPEPGGMRRTGGFPTLAWIPIGMAVVGIIIALMFVLMRRSGMS